MPRLSSLHVHFRLPRHSQSRMRRRNQKGTARSPLARRRLETWRRGRSTAAANGTASTGAAPGCALHASLPPLSRVCILLQIDYSSPFTFACSSMLARLISHRRNCKTLRTEEMLSDQNVLQCERTSHPGAIRSTRKGKAMFFKQPVRRKMPHKLNARIL